MGNDNALVRFYPKHGLKPFPPSLGLVERGSNHIHGMDEAYVLMALDRLNSPILRGKYSFSDVIFQPPVTPSKVICVGRNYRAHAIELGNKPPKEPVLFFKPPSSLIGHMQAIRLPSVSKRVDYEGELALIIRKRLFKATKEEIKKSENLLAVTNFNDVTARDLQRSDKTWLRGKGYDTFGPIGPWCVPLTGMPSDFTISTILNGKEVQKAHSSEMLFDIPTILSYISNIMTLNPRDVIVTGTPEGVGPLSQGDKVSVSCSLFDGTLTNVVE